MHLVGDLFELYDDARTYKPKILLHVFKFSSKCKNLIDHSDPKV